MMRHEYSEEDWALLTGIKEQPKRPQDGDDRQAPWDSEARRVYTSLLLVHNNRLRWMNS